MTERQKVIAELAARFLIAKPDYDVERSVWQASAIVSMAGRIPDPSEDQANHPARKKL